MRLSSEQLIEFLRTVISALEQDDSFGGNLSYEAEGYRLFEVEAAVRVGNSEGQGGYIILERGKPEEQNP